MPRLDVLRKAASFKWAINAQLNPKHTDLLPLFQNKVNTRNRKYLKNISAVHKSITTVQSYR